MPAYGDIKLPSAPSAPSLTSTTTTVTASGSRPPPRPQRSAVYFWPPQRSSAPKDLGRPPVPSFPFYSATGAPCARAEQLVKKVGELTLLESN